MLVLARILLDLLGDLNILLRPHIRSIFRLAIRVIVQDVLVLDVRHGAVKSSPTCPAVHLTEFLI